MNPLFSLVRTIPVTLAAPRPEVQLPTLTDVSIFHLGGEPVFAHGLVPEGFDTTRLGIAPFHWKFSRDTFLFGEPGNRWALLQISGSTGDFGNMGSRRIQEGGFTLTGLSGEGNDLWGIDFRFTAGHETGIEVFATPAQPAPYRPPEGRKIIPATRSQGDQILVGAAILGLPTGWDGAVGRALAQLGPVSH